MILDGVVFLAAIGHTLGTFVKPGKCRLDTVGSIVGERQGNGSCGGNGGKVRVTYAMLANKLLYVVGQS